MSGSVVAYKYWFWAGAAFMVVSMFLPVYHFELMGSSIMKPLGIQVWYESITFGKVNSGLAQILCFVFAIFNLLQIVYLAPKHDGSMIEGVLPKMFLVIAFGLMPLCIVHELYSQFSFANTRIFDSTNVLREGAYVYLAGYIASGIGIVQLRKHTKAEITQVEVV